MKNVCFLSGLKVGVGNFLKNLTNISGASSLRYNYLLTNELSMINNIKLTAIFSEFVEIQLMIIGYQKTINR